MPITDDEYKQYIASKYDLSGVTSDLSAVDGKVLALAAIMRTYKVSPAEITPGGDGRITEENLQSAKHVAGVMTFFGLSLGENDRGLPRQMQSDGPYVVPRKGEG